MPFSLTLPTFFFSYVAYPGYLLLEYGMSYNTLLSTTDDVLILLHAYSMFGNPFCEQYP